MQAAGKASGLWLHTRDFGYEMRAAERGDVLLGKREKAPYPNGKQKMIHTQPVRPEGEQPSSFSAGSAYHKEMGKCRCLRRRLPHTCPSTLPLLIPTRHRSAWPNTASVDPCPPWGWCAWSCSWAVHREQLSSELL